MNNQQPERQRDLLIMVVEDHWFQRKTLVHQVRSLGYQNLLEAADGAEALALCQQHDVDILLCDLLMPEMDGMALLRELSQSGFRGGVILSSALKDDVVAAVDRMAEAYGLQVLGRIDKPSTPAQLQLLIDTWLPAQQWEPQEGFYSLGEVDLRQALEQDQLLPWYQPKVSFATGEWVGMEALARWVHPEHGMIAPAHFISLAEQCGLIEQLTYQMISKSLQVLGSLQQDGQLLTLSLNLSALSLTQAGVFDVLLEQCHHHGINPEQITLEVTESALVHDLGASLEVLTRLRMHGFGLAIDDFGTGYSSMQQLALLPFTELKLDRSFVDRCYGDPPRQAIVESCIALARKLGLKSVAEGVEDGRTWHLLRQLGCDVCQGFFSARPMPAGALREWHYNWQARLTKLLAD